MTEVLRDCSDAGSVLHKKRRNKGVNLRAKCLWAMRPFLFQRKIPCLPFWLACRSGYAFGVQYVQYISNYWHSWLASKSAVLKNMKCKLGFLFYPGLVLLLLFLLFLLLLWNSICSLFKKIKISNFNSVDVFLLYSFKMPFLSLWCQWQTVGSFL